MEDKNLLKSSLLSLTEAKKFSTLKEILVTMNSVDIATLFNELPEEILPKLFRLLPKELAAQTFVEMDSDLQELLIKGFSDKELKEVVNELYVDDAVDIVEEMPANVVKRILQSASADMRKDINNLLKYPEDSAGSVMTTEFVDMKLGITVEQALKHIHKTGLDKETVNTCYVTEKDRTLIGIVTLRALVLAERETPVADIMEKNVISVSTDEDKETVAQLFGKYDFTALPVVDAENRLVGIVTVDDAIDILQDEATEDIEKMAAVTPTEDAYLKRSVFQIWKSRIPWLLLLMISATFTGGIISAFEGNIISIAGGTGTALIAFIPMLMDTGGNAGGQASVTVIRALALGDIKFKDFFRVVWKEIRVSVFCAVTLSAANFVKIITIDKYLLNNSSITLNVAFAVCVTLAATVVLAKLIGATLPLIAKKIGFDPAVMASPFITTIVDAVSLLVYFNIAFAMLK